MRPIREEDFCLAGQEGPLWASVCYFLAASQWKKIIDAFQTFDEDGSGTLSSAEFLKILTRGGMSIAARAAEIEGGTCFTAEVRFSTCSTGIV